eukprot:Opistho-2@80665
MLPTPDLSHLKSRDYDVVYEPAEDTFLFLDALEKDAEQLTAMKPAICVEIGSGAGAVLTFLAKIIGPTAALYLATDINPHATKATVGTGKQNGVSIDAINCYFASPLVPMLENRVDILLFNPPYVVTPSDEVGGDGVMAAWAGGDKGREVTDKFLFGDVNSSQRATVDALLSERGFAYVVLIEENDPEEIIALMKRLGFDGVTVMARKAGRERLSVVRFHRSR